MTDRMIDLSEAPASLRVELAQLLIRRQDLPDVRVPLSEVAVLVMAHPGIRCTHAVLSSLMAGGGAVIVCDAQCLPIGLMLPTQAHCTQTERFIAQAAAPLPLRKRTWRQIVQAKILAQGRLLLQLRGHDAGLRELARSVRSGDAANCEGLAARRYWPALFDDPAFRRRRDADDANRLLNYGYAVLRALVGRAVCAAGLHPSLGLHHHNRYNPFCLADDLMEPYRPLVDAAVIDHIACWGKDAPLDKTARQTLLAALHARYRAEGEVRTLSDWIGRTASSLANVYLQRRGEIFFPGEWERAGE